MSQGQAGRDVFNQSDSYDRIGSGVGSMDTISSDIPPERDTKMTATEENFNSNSITTPSDDITSSNMDTDVWDDVWGEEETADHKDIQRMHHKQGYVDGLSQAKESSLQLGFDEGLPKGAQLGIEVGRILATILSYDESLFEQCKKELVISKVLDKQYFDKELEIQHHNLLDKWKNISEEIRLR